MPSARRFLAARRKQLPRDYRGRNVNQVRKRLAAGGSWIRTLGPPIAKGSFRFGEGEAGKGTETTRGGPDTLST
jgi:hypothetical protein